MNRYHHLHLIALVAVTYLTLIIAETTRSELSRPDAAAISAAKALATGDGKRVMSLLLPDALIVEAGTVQTRNEYQSEHLSEDIAYARAVPSTQRNVVVRQEGDVAWVTSTFQVTGKFHDKPVDNLAAETMILTKTPDGWRIRILHWSSHKATKD